MYISRNLGCGEPSILVADLWLSLLHYSLVERGLGGSRGGLVTCNVQNAALKHIYCICFGFPINYTSNHHEQ